MLTIGRRYLFMTQRYAFAGTVVYLTPTHAVLGDDAIVIYEDIGGFEEWAQKDGPIGGSGKRGRVPGQGVSLVGTDFTPLDRLVTA